MTGASPSSSLYTGFDSIGNSKTWPDITTGASLLLAWQLQGRRVLIVGGGNVAADRLRSVLPADAEVTLVCPREGMGEEVQHRVDNESKRFRLQVRERDFRDEDVLEEDWDMVLTALDDPILSKHIHSLCKKRHFNINVADVPPLCDFYFGSVIRRGPLQVMISTNGKGPRLANRIRRQIEAGLPENVGEAIEHIGTLRAKLRKTAPGSDASTVKRRMEWMVRVTDSWTLDELAGMSEAEQNAILSGWEDDMARSYTSASGRYWRRSLCPYWISQILFNPNFWWMRGHIDAETLEKARQKCPVYNAKSAVETSNVLYWISGGSGLVLGALALLAGQHTVRRFSR